MPPLVSRRMSSVWSWRCCEVLNPVKRFEIHAIVDLGSNKCQVISISLEGGPCVSLQEIRDILVLGILFYGRRRHFIPFSSMSSTFSSSICSSCADIWCGRTPTVWLDVAIQSPRTPALIRLFHSQLQKHEMLVYNFTWPRYVDSRFTRWPPCFWINSTSTTTSEASVYNTQKGWNNPDKLKLDLQPSSASIL